MFSGRFLHAVAGGGVWFDGVPSALCQSIHSIPWILMAFPLFRSQKGDKCFSRFFLQVGTPGSWETLIAILSLEKKVGTLIPSKNTSLTQVLIFIGCRTTILSVQST